MAFFWEGNTGGRVTPAMATRKRNIAGDLLGESRTKANNWGEGLARVAQALSGTVLEGQAAEMSQAGADEVAALLAGLSPESGFGDISAALANPWLAESPGGSAIAQALLGENMRRSDPMYGLSLDSARMGNERAALELDALRNPAPAAPSFDFEGGQWWQRNPDGSVPFAVSDVVPDPTTNMREYDAYAADEMAAGRIPLGRLEYEQAIRSAGGQTINVNTGNTDDFFSGLSSVEGEQFAGMLAAGTQAARTSQQLDQLEGLLANSPQGFEGAATAFASNFGIDLGGAQGVQAAQALINQLVPAQRPPGSGPMSDADLELFKQSLPRIINQPGGNELIMQTMRGMADYDRQLAAIVQNGISQAELTDDPALRAQIRRDMRTAIDQLQNPIDAFRQQSQGISSTLPSATSQMASPATEADFNALPSGTPFRAPDGSIRVKP